MSRIFTINLKDLLGGASAAFAVAAVLVIYGMLKEGFDAFTVQALLEGLRVSLLASMGYLVTHLVKDEQGKLGGKF